MGRSTGQSMAPRPKTGAPGWPGRLRIRLSASLLLSVLLHAGIAALVLLLVLYAATYTRPPARDVTVSVVSGGPEEPNPTSPAPGAAGAAAGPERDTATVVGDPSRAIEAEAEMRNDYLAAQAGRAIAKSAAEATAQDKQQQRKKIRKEISRRLADIGKELADNEEEFQRLLQRAQDVIAQIDASKKQKERWARWQLRHSMAAVQAAGGKLVVIDYPGKGKYTHVVNLAGEPRREPGKKPDSMTFSPVNRATQAIFIDICRRAGIALRTGMYVPCVVFPRKFESHLEQVERQYKKERHPADDRKIKNTSFQVHRDGKATVILMTLKKGTI